MSMGFKPCMNCSGAAEALIAVDNMIEYYCPDCEMSWAEEPPEQVDIVTHQPLWGYNNLGEEVC